MRIVVSFSVMGCFTTKDIGALTECSLPSKFKIPDIHQFENHLEQLM